MPAKHIIPGLDDPTCGIAVAAKRLIARGVGEDGEVWVHSMWTPMVITASIKSLLARKKLVRMPHGCTDPTKLRHHWLKKRWVAPIERWLFRHADRIIATCENEVEWIKEFEPHVKNIEIVRLSAPRVNAPVQDARPSFSAASSLKLLYVGRLHPLKGVEYLLEAMPQDAKLVVIGKDEGEEQKLKSIAVRRSLNIEFRGIVSEEAKNAAYDWCDALVLPTLSENFGLVIAEALERGKRVITTDGAPAWGDNLSRVEVERGSEDSRVEGGEILFGYNGRLIYLKGYRDGSSEKRIELLRDAIKKLAPQGIQS